MEYFEFILQPKIDCEQSQQSAILLSETVFTYSLVLAPLNLLIALSALFITSSSFCSSIESVLLASMQKFAILNRLFNAPSGRIAVNLTSQYLLDINNYKISFNWLQLKMRMSPEDDHNSQKRSRLSCNGLRKSCSESESFNQLYRFNFLDQASLMIGMSAANDVDQSLGWFKCIRLNISALVDRFSANSGKALLNKWRKMAKI